MNTTRTLIVATIGTLFLGVGSSMAQESPGGVGRWQEEQLQKALSGMHHGAALTAQPQAGASDLDRARTPTYPDAVLIGGGGGN